MPDVKICQQDVPWMGRPIGYYFILSLTSVGYILLLIGVPDIRPALIEGALGIVGGGIAGWLMSKQWILYLAGLAAKAQQKPWLIWASTIIYPLPPMKEYANFIGVQLATSLISFFLYIFILQKLITTFPELGLPWARFSYGNGTDALSYSLPPTLLLYLLVSFDIMWIRAIRWYYRLPVDVNNSSLRIDL